MRRFPELGAGWYYTFNITRIIGDCAGIHYNTNMDLPDNYQTTYDIKTKIVGFYSLTNAFKLILTFLEVNF